MRTRMSQQVCSALPRNCDGLRLCLNTNSTRLLNSGIGLTRIWSRHLITCREPDAMKEQCVGLDRLPMNTWLVPGIW